MRRGALPGLLGVLLLAGCGSHAHVAQNKDRAITEGDQYVALGDSYTAAPGVGTSTGSKICLQTDANYPHLVAERLGLELRDVSCSGASTLNMAGRQILATGSVPPQLDALTKQTRLVTLGIGGNDDAGFARIVLTCPALAKEDPSGSPCSDLIGNTTKVLDAYQTTVSQRIVNVIGQIHQRSPDARVLVVGYPEIVGTKSCAELPLASGDVAFAHAANLAFTDALRMAADKTGAEYVDVWSATQGHDMCSADPWEAGRAPTGPAAQFHPYAKEQQVVAGLVADALKATPSN